MKATIISENASQFFSSEFQVIPLVGDTISFSAPAGYKSEHIVTEIEHRMEFTDEFAMVNIYIHTKEKY
jgi:hypothetical protein